jgi:hypothetical protein
VSRPISSRGTLSPRPARLAPRGLAGAVVGGWRLADGADVGVRLGRESGAGVTAGGVGVTDEAEDVTAVSAGNLGRWVGSTPAFGAVHAESTPFVSAAAVRVDAVPARSRHAVAGKAVSAMNATSRRGRGCVNIGGGRKSWAVPPPGR